MTLKVSSNSKPSSVAGAIAKNISEENINIIAIGASALNQTIKAVAIARGYLAPSGYDIAVKPSFTNIEIDDNRRTAIMLTIIKDKE